MLVPPEQGPERGMKVTMMLADAAQVADGKLNILGGGWSVISGATPFAIAMMIEVPWHLSNKKHEFKLEVIDLDGNLVQVEAPDGNSTAVVVDGQFEVGRPPGVRNGAMLPFTAAINIGPVPWPAGGSYEWRLSIDGQAHEDWRLAFTTRPDAQSQSNAA